MTIEAEESTRVEPVVTTEIATATGKSKKAPKETNIESTLRQTVATDEATLSYWAQITLKICRTVSRSVIFVSGPRCYVLRENGYSVDEIAAKP